MSTEAGELAWLHEKVADLERRLDAQDQAWTAWRAASDRITGGADELSQYDAAMSPKRHLRLLPH